MNKAVASFYHIESAVKAHYFRWLPNEEIFIYNFSFNSWKSC